MPNSETRTLEAKALTPSEIAVIRRMVELARLHSLAFFDNKDISLPLASTHLLALFGDFNEAIIEKDAASLEDKIGNLLGFLMALTRHISDVGVESAWRHCGDQEDGMDEISDPN